VITHLLDTSALLAHFRNETGAGEVQAIFEDAGNAVGISVVSIAEFGIRLSTLGMSQPDMHAIISSYQELLDDVLPLTEDIAIRATSLKTSASARLPLVDALIAATAISENATLVHRDAHFLALTGREVKQFALTGSSKP
jgi:predicted nucleic acid-binding protein